MNSELTELQKVAGLVAAATVTMGVAGDRLASLLEDGGADLPPILEAIRNCLDTMGNIGDQVVGLIHEQVQP